MHGQNRVEGFGRISLDRGHGAKISGVGKQHINAAKAGDGFGCIAGGVGFVCHISRDGQHAGGKGVCRARQCLRVAVHQRNIRSMALQDLGRGKADASRTTGDKAGLAFKSEHLSSFHTPK